MITPRQQLVLAVLATQSPGYLADPGCSAFLAVGLTAGDVTATLHELEASGHVLHQVEQATAEVQSVGQAPTLDANGQQVVDANGVPVTHAVMVVTPEIVTTNAGWKVTAAGRALLPPQPTL